MVAYRFALCYPEMVLGVVTLGVPFMPPGPPVHYQKLPEGFYISRWRVHSNFLSFLTLYNIRKAIFSCLRLHFSWFSLKEPGRAEADFGRLDAKTVVRNIYILFSKSEIPIASENQEIMDLVEPSTPLPSWLTEEEFATYGSLYEKSGFQTALQVPYR